MNTALMKRAIYLIRPAPCSGSSCIHKYEIRKILGQVAQKGYTIVPLKVYFKDNLVKMEIGLARGKKLYDKRDSIAKKDQRREAERDFKVKNLY